VVVCLYQVDIGETSNGGDIILKRGSGIHNHGKVHILDGNNEERLSISDQGKVELSSSQQPPLFIQSGDVLHMSGESIQITNNHGKTAVSINPTKKEFISHFDAHLNDILIPADIRMFDQNSEKMVDKNALLQKVMNAPIQQFDLIDTWDSSKPQVRTLVGQNIVNVMPEWINVKKDHVSSLNEKYDDFNEVKDPQVLLTH